MHPVEQGAQRTALGREEREQMAEGRFPLPSARCKFHLQQLQQSLLVCNWPVQPQQALQLNHKMNHGTEFCCLPRQMDAKNNLYYIYCYIYM